MTKAACYIRVSTQDQGDRFSPAAQERACIDYAERLGFEMVLIYHDEETGRIIDRTGIQQALKDAQAGLYEELIVYDHSRWGRDIQVSQSLREDFTAAGIIIHTTTSGPSDPLSEGSFISDTTQDMMSEAESRRLSRRFKDGKQQAAREGSIQVSTPPYGYSRVRMDGKTTLEIDPAEAVHIRKIFELYASGSSLASIARRLNSAKVPKRHPSKWADDGLRNLLSSSTYIGKWIFGKTRSDYPRSKRGRIIKGNPADMVVVEVPSIIEPGVFKATQLRLEMNRTARAKGAKHKYLLRGRVLCTTCGKTYNSRTPYKNYAYYIHPTPKHDNSTNFRRDVLEDAATSFILAILQNPEALVEELSREKNDERDSFVADQIIAAKQRRNNIARQFGRARQAYLNESFTEQEYLIEKKRLEESDKGLVLAIARLEIEMEPDAYELEGMEAMIHEQTQYLSEGGDIRDFYSTQDWSYFISLIDLTVEVSGNKIRMTAGIDEKFWTLPGLTLAEDVQSLKQRVGIVLTEFDRRHYTRYS